MRTLALALACGVGVFGQLASAADTSANVAGKKLFERHCAECHAPGFGHPGTQQLGWTRGAKRAVLEERTDLVAAYVVAVARNGLLEMPPFRPSEISDAELRTLSEYLARSGRPKKR